VGQHPTSHVSTARHGPPIHLRLVRPGPPAHPPTGKLLVFRVFPIYLPDSTLVPAEQPKVALQHPFRGDVSYPKPMRSSASFDSVGTEARGGLQGRSEQGLRCCQTDATDPAGETPRTTELRCWLLPQTKQSRPRGRPARLAAEGSEMGGKDRRTAGRSEAGRRRGIKCRSGDD